VSDKASPQWERSVEKARLALVKTFEGRVEAALASFEQIPGGQGRKKNGEQTLAQFALDAGIEYNTLVEYRKVTKWLGEKGASASFSEDTARYRIGDLMSYTMAREALRAGKWANATQFVAFKDATDPPEPFAKWTVDALRVHLGQKPTNTGSLAIKLAEGEKVSEDELHGAAAKDHAEEVADEIKEIKSPLTAAVVAADAADTVRAAAPETGLEIKGTKEHLEALALLGDIANLTSLLESYLSDVAGWLARYGQKSFDGETGAELMLASLAEKKGRLDLAFSKAGVGSDIESGFAALLNEEE
jgi:hypothetical protein